MRYWLAAIVFIVSVSVAGRGQADESIQFVTLLLSDLILKAPVEPSHLPPDPGEDGSLTIEGSDANANGIRDDIERYIAYTYVGDKNSDLRDRLKNFAYWQQKAIVLSGTANSSVPKSIVEGGYCIQKLLGEDEGHDAYAEIIARYLNTGDRSNNYIDYLEHVQSKFWGSNASTNPACNF